MGNDPAVFHDGVIICAIASLETSVIVRFIRNYGSLL